MRINLTKFKKLEEEKLLSCQKHPTADLLIWDYSERCQFDRIWTPETMMSRGLITSPEGDILARPFGKFFNYEEHIGQDSKLPALPVEEKFTVTEKADGSLGILYWVDGHPAISTRGSFTSDQAIKATDILKRKYSDVKLPKDRTLLWEIIFPANRIVVDYGRMEDLVLLTAFDIETGQETPYSVLREEFPMFPIVKQFDGITDIAKLKALEEKNKEGFVVRFESGVRVKIKFEEYKRLHKILTGINAVKIWEILKEGGSMDEIIHGVPDEFMKWVDLTVKDLKNNYAGVEHTVSVLWSHVAELPTRKEQAFKLLEEGNKFSSLVFRKLDGKEYSDLIWKMIKPEATKPFTNDIDV